MRYTDSSISSSLPLSDCWNEDTALTRLLPLPWKPTKSLANVPPLPIAKSGMDGRQPKKSLSKCSVERKRSFHNSTQWERYPHKQCILGGPVYPILQDRHARMYNFPYRLHFAFFISLLVPFSEAAGVSPSSGLSHRKEPGIVKVVGLPLSRELSLL